MAKKKNKKKNEQTKQEYRKVSAQEAQAAFAQLARDVCVDIVVKFSHGNNRIGMTAASIMDEQEGLFNVVLSLTDGMLELMPALSPEDQARHRKLYAEKIVPFKEKNGTEIKGWAQGSLAELESGSFLIVTFYVERLRSHKAEFEISIMLLHDDRQVMLKEADQSIGLLTDGMIVCGNNKEELRARLQRAFDDYVTGYMSWRTTRLNHIESFFYTVSSDLESDGYFMDYWTLEEVCMTRDAFVFMLWTPDPRSVARIPAGDLKDKCAAMVGEIYGPGQPAAIMVSAEPNEEGCRMLARGPMPYDPALMTPEMDLWRESQKYPVLFERQVPEKDFTPDYEEADEGEDRIEREATEIENAILDLLGFGPEECAADPSFPEPALD